MPFKMILQGLIDELQGSVGALFLDWEGEAVELVGRYHDRYDLHLVGAYQGIFLNQLEKAAVNVSLGKLLNFKVGFDHLTFFNCTLADGYYLVLIVEKQVPEWLAWETLRKGRKLLVEEIE